MGFVRNVSGEDRFDFSRLRPLVESGEVIEVADAGSYLCQSGVWEEADDPVAAVFVPPAKPAPVPPAEPANQEA